MNKTMKWLLPLLLILVTSLSGQEGRREYYNAKLFSPVIQDSVVLEIADGSDKFIIAYRTSQDTIYLYSPSSTPISISGLAITVAHNDLTGVTTSQHHVKTVDTVLDSTGVVALGFVAGAHAVDTTIDSVGIVGLGFVAGAHTTDTNLDSLGIVALGFVAGAHTTDTTLDSSGVDALGFVPDAELVPYTTHKDGDGSDHADVSTNTTGISTLQNYIDFFNGTFLESFDATVTSNGTVVTMSLQKSGGGDLTMVTSAGLVVLDCTDPVQTITLTVGSDVSPTDNFIYIPQSTGALTKSTSDWLSGAEHIKIGYFLIPSAGFTQTNGVYVNQNWNDHQMNGDNQGHMSHMAERSRRLGAIYLSGIDGNGTEGYLTPTASNVELKHTSGIIYQMHEHVEPAFDTSTGDVVLIKNWSGDAYHDITNLFDITADAGGNAIGANKYFNLVLWGVANKTGSFHSMLINLPSGFYNGESDALNDVSGYDDFTIPAEYGIESSTGYLVARITIQMGTTWSVSATADLRGTTPQTASARANGAVVEYADNTFRVFDESDITKELSFQLSGVTTGNTRELTVPDANGTIATQSWHTSNDANTQLDSTGIDALNFVPDLELTTHTGTSSAHHTQTAASTDDQKIDVFSLSGNTISASLESDGEANKTLDISGATSIAANTTHSGSDGSDHSLIQTGVAEVYDATGWDGDTGTPQKNDVRDKIESLAGGHDAVTLNASATTGGLSLSTQEIGFRAATNAQTGYATAAQVTAQEANTTHITADGSGHTFIDQDITSGSSPTLDGNNFTGVDADDVDIADAGVIITATEVEGALQENRTAINLNTTHISSDGSDHSLVNTNTTHISSNGSDHSLVNTNTTHISSDGSDHSLVNTNTTHTTGDGSDHGISYSKSISVESPTSSEDISLWYTEQAITVTEMRAVLNNGTATPTVTWVIRFASSRELTGGQVVSGGTVTTSVSSGSDVTSFDDATIPADRFIWLTTTAQGGTTPELMITIIYTID